MKTLPILLLVLLSTSPHLHAGEPVDYIIADQAYEGYYTSPSPSAPLVLLLHDWDGLTEYEIKRADMLSDLGYAVFAADLFGKGVRPTEIKDKREHTGELYKDRQKMRSLMEGALMAASFKGADVENTVIVGYCFGGAAALEFARSGMQTKGVVTFHGGLGTPEGQNYASTKAKVLIFHGSADTMITLQDFATLAEELEEAKVPNELITYGGAPHSFTVFDSGAYHEASDNSSWARFTSFLGKTIPLD
jgi:dienelactone hydrolase